MIAILWSLVLLSAWTGADVEEPILPFADQYDEAFEEAKLRNVPVVIFDFDGWSTRAGHHIEDFYNNGPLLKALENAVLLLASQETHEQIVQRVRGTERQVCAVYGGVSCSGHLRMLPKVFTDYGEDGQLKSPLFLIALPDGALLKRITEEVTAAELLTPVKEAQEKLGPGLSTADFVRLSDGIERASRWLRLGECKPAVDALEELAKLPGVSPLHELVATRRQELQQQGVERLDKARQSWEEGRHREALWAADAVGFDFGDTEVGRQAESLTKEQLRTREGKDLSKELNAHRKARGLYTEGVVLDDAGETKKALATLKRLLRSYPDSIWAQKAQSLVDVLEDEGSGR